MQSFAVIWIEIDIFCVILREKEVIELIDFQKIDLSKKAEYESYLQCCAERGCEYSFANLNMWGRQRAAFLGGCLVIFSQFERRSVYLFPVGNGDLKEVLDAIIHDAGKRGIVCRLSGLTAQDCATLEEAAMLCGYSDASALLHAIASVTKKTP